MTFRPNKERFLLLLGISLAALGIMVNQAISAPEFWPHTGILLLIFCLLFVWLACFEIRFSDEQIFYRSLFGGKVAFKKNQIKSIKPNKYDELTHLLYSKHTLFIHLNSGEKVKINTKVFPAEVAETMQQLLSQHQAAGGK